MTKQHMNFYIDMDVSSQKFYTFQDKSTPNMDEVLEDIIEHDIDSKAGNHTYAFTIVRDLLGTIAEVNLIDEAFAHRKELLSKETLNNEV